MIEQPVMVRTEHNDIVETVAATTPHCLNVASINRVQGPPANCALLGERLVGGTSPSVGLNASKRTFYPFFGQFRVATLPRTEASICSGSRSSNDEWLSTRITDDRLTTALKPMLTRAVSRTVLGPVVLRWLGPWYRRAAISAGFQGKRFRFGTGERAKTAGRVPLRIEESTANSARCVRRHSFYCTAPLHSEVVAWIG